jgi:hypothetical protein
VSCSSSSAFRWSEQGRNFCAPSQVHQWHCEEVQDGGLQGHDNTDEYDYNTGCGRGRWTRRPEGVLEHDWLPPVPNGDEAGHTILYVSVHSFSSVSKDFALASSQAHLQVFALHSRLWPLVLRVFFFGAWRYF